MTKREHIQMKVRRVIQFSAIISVLAIAMMVYAQMKRVDSRGFWIATYIGLGLCSLGVVAFLHARLKCPDCGYHLWSQYLRSLWGGNQ